MTSEERAARIAEIENILAAGVTSVSYGGTTTTYDFPSLRAELRRLQLGDETQPSKRPVASSINLGGF